MSLSYLNVKAITWNRDSHGLFDYDTTQVTKECLKLFSCGSLMRRGNDVSFLSEYSSPTTGHLVKILAADGHFLIYPCKHEQIGLVIKKLKNKPRQSYKLSQGDTIKLGRVKLRVKQIITTDSLKEPSGDEYEGSNNGEICCRICFRTHNNKIDPLFSVCKCAGSMELVHLACVQKYMISKAVKKSYVNCVTYLWKSIECDVCKEAIPLTIVHDFNNYDIIAIPREAGSKCIILEDFRRQKYKCIMHVMFGVNAPMLIGRSTDTDLKINDISVSRNHASIELISSEFYIKDCDSKFGTVIVQKRPLLIDKSQSHTIQVGRSLLSFSVRSQFKILSCFTSCCKKYNKVDQIPKSRTEIVWEGESFQYSENDEGYN